VAAQPLHCVESILSVRSPLTYHQFHINHDSTFSKPFNPPVFRALTAGIDASHISIKMTGSTPNGQRATTRLSTNKKSKKGGLFQHTPLDAESFSIRLTQILPDLSEDGLLQCRVQTVVLDQHAVDFFCVSYTWGNLVQDQQIRINGRKLSVHRNLYNFLAAVRNHAVRAGGLPSPP